MAIAEAAWVLESVYELDAAALATAVDMLLNHEQLTVQDSEVVEFARKGHTPLGTFDRGLGKVDGAHRVR